jgi:hypothetical protein
MADGIGGGGDTGFSSEQQAQLQILIQSNMQAVLEEMSRSLKETGKQGGEMGKSFEGLAKIMHGPVGTIAGIAAVGYGLARTVTDFAQAQSSLKLFADSAHLTSREIIALQNTMERAGVPTQAANAAISGIAETMKDMQVNKTWGRALEDLRGYGNIGMSAFGTKRIFLRFIR